MEEVDDGKTLSQGNQSDSSKQFQSKSKAPTELGIEKTNLSRMI